MITIACCGENYFADEQHIGRAIRCRKCGRQLTIKPPLTAGPTGKPITHRPEPSRKVDPVFLNADIVGPARSKVILTAIGIIIVVVVCAFVIELETVKQPASRTPEVPATDASRPMGSGEVERPPVSLPTGTWLLKQRDSTGHGILTIENGTDLDSVVKLITTRSPRRALWMIYIAARRRQTVTGVPPGTYLLRFALGRDWDKNNRTFLRNRSFYQAGMQFEFIETRRGDEGTIEYEDQRVTLNEVPGGNLTREAISEIEFNEGAPE